MRVTAPEDDLAFARSTHLFSLAGGLAVVAACVASGSALAYVAAVLLVPCFAVLVARALVLHHEGRRRRLGDRRGYAAAAIVALAVGVASLRFQWLPGPAEMVALIFAVLGWQRRDALTAATAGAALIATAPADVLGPLYDLNRSADGDLGSAVAIFTTALVACGLGLWTSTRSRRAS